MIQATFDIEYTQKESKQMPLNKPEKGKGENWDRRANPFNRGKDVRSAPSFTDITDIARLLDSLCRAGCALMVSNTRDGGSVVLTILDGDTRERTYCSNQHELQGAIDSALAAYGND